MESTGFIGFWFFSILFKRILIWDENYRRNRKWFEGKQASFQRKSREMVLTMQVIISNKCIGKEKVSTEQESSSYVCPETEENAKIAGKCSVYQHFPLTYVTELSTQTWWPVFSGFPSSVWPSRVLSWPEEYTQCKTMSHLYALSGLRQLKYCFIFPQNMFLSDTHNMQWSYLYKLFYVFIISTVINNFIHIFYGSR